MNLETCEVCGEFIPPTFRHKCAPIWFVRLDWHENGDEQKVHAVDAKGAAVRYCEEFDSKSGDYPIASKRGAIVIVYDENMVLVGKYDIAAETIPIYHAALLAISDEERAQLTHEVTCP